MNEDLKQQYLSRVSRVDSEASLLTEAEKSRIVSAIVNRCSMESDHRRRETKAFSFAAFAATAFALFVMWYVPLVELSEEAIETVLHAQMLDEFVQMEVL